MLEVPNRDRKRERRESIRGEILDAAWSLARDQGLPGFTLREVARLVGMQAPSLYTHFDSRHAIIDAMFGQAWRECDEAMRAITPEHPLPARAWLRLAAHSYFDFCTGDPVRNQLMNQRSVPGFVPTAASYAYALAVLERLTSGLASYSVTRREDIDLYTALIGGLVDAQLANDPGGDRWRRLLDRSVDMYADNVGL